MLELFNEIKAQLIQAVLDQPSQHDAGEGEWEYYHGRIEALEEMLTMVGKKL